MNLLDLRLNDGSRQFAALPESWPWTNFRDHIEKLPGADVTQYLSDNVTEVWIDFTYRDQTFSINNQFGEYWLFVENPLCPDEVLRSVVDHCVLKTGVGKEV